MPERPLVWLTISFMLGIAAARLFEGNPPGAPYSFLIASVLLIACLAVSLRLSARRPHFAIAAALFGLFGMWAAQSCVLAPPDKLKPFLHKPFVY